MYGLWAKTYGVQFGPGGQAAVEQYHEPSCFSQQDTPFPIPALSTSSSSTTEESSSWEGEGLGGSKGPQQEGCSPVSVLPRHSLGDTSEVGALAGECVAPAVRAKQSNCCATVYDSLQPLLPHTWLQ